MLDVAASATFFVAAALGARQALLGTDGTLLLQGGSIPLWQPALQVDLAAALAHYWREELHQRADACVHVLLLLG
tara:strand:+ start:286 stop:510 length:225 start_codon:yes stop_codon:yes gene_type:complete